MPLILRLPLTILVGTGGGIICKKKKLFPAAYMIGAFIFVIALSVGTGQAYFPPQLRIMTRVLVGAHLGMRLKRKQMSLIRKRLPSIAAIMVCLLLNMLIVAFAIYLLCDMELSTALYACAPGGVSDMAIIAEASGADFVPVSVLQLTRLITVFSYYPALYGRFLRKGVIVAPTSGGGAEKTEKNERSPKDKTRGALLVLAIAVAGAAVGEMLGIPGGALTFAMLFVAAANMFTEGTYLPAKVAGLAQILSGIYLGAQFTRETAGVLSTLLVPFLLMILSVATLPMLTGYAVHKITGTDLATALFCCTPGGMAEMTLMADDIGLDVAEVSVTHVVRITVVVAVFPQIIGLITSWPGIG